MGVDTATRREIDGLKQVLRDLQQQVNRQGSTARTPQLGHSSISEGSLDVIHPVTGEVRARFGYQPDGTVGLVAEGGDPAPAPTAPTVEEIPAGNTISWDGLLADGLAVPADLDHVNVHVSTAPGFAPGPDTFAGVTIRRGGGRAPVAPLPPGVVHYFRLVPVGTGGVQGAPSGEASGTPGGVSGIEPGSITETEIADDAISTPKLRAESVTALKIAVDAIQAGHISAGAVTAASLAGEIVLGTTIIAGTPGGARVELDSGGIRGYNADDELVFAIQDGNALFTGTVAGSNIIGSTLSLSLPSGNLSIAEDEFGRPALTLLRVGENPAGLTLTPGSVTLESTHDSGSHPYLRQSATDTFVESFYQAPGGGALRIFSEDRSALWLYAPRGGMSGAMSASNRSGTEAPLMGIASPSHSPTGGSPRQYAVMELEGSTAAQPGSRSLHYADQHLFGLGGGAVATDGVLSVDQALSILAPRHAPVRTDMVTAPAGTFAGGWQAFASGAFPSLTFRTGWSGRARVTITAAAGNTTTANATVHFGFELVGGGTVVPPAVSRAWNARSVAMQCCSRVVHLDLAANTSYLLVPRFNISSGTVGSTVTIQDTYEHSIVVEPLM